MATRPDPYLFVGYRCEFIDGMLVVSPRSSFRHQKVVMMLGFALQAVCPDHMHVLPAPFAVRPSDTTELQPDVLVGREEDFTEKLLPTAPLLAVEILSPSSVINDLNNKKAAYARMGVPSYWVVDPQQPMITVFELTDGQYTQVAEVKDGDPLEVDRPFPVRVTPRELLGTLA